MQTTIQKWGNSRGIRIPKAFLEAVGLMESDCVNIERVNDSIVIKKASPNRKKLTLDEIFAGYDGGSDMEEFDWGAPSGREVW